MKTSWGRIAPLGVAARDLIFPAICRLCSAATKGTPAEFCPACAEAIEAEHGEPACPRCAQSLPPPSAGVAACRECQDQPTVLDGIVRAGPYGPALGRLLRGLKYKGREELEPIFGRWLAAAVRAAPWVSRIEAITWVPTHWRTRLQRPLHAAEVLADHVAHALRLPAIPLLRRTSAGRHQVGLTYTERIANVRGLYTMRKGVQLEHARILIVDDVRTTGATLDHCARVLRHGGAAEVYGAVALKVTWAMHPTGAPLMI